SNDDLSKVIEDHFSGKVFWWAKGQHLARGIRRGDSASILAEVRGYVDSCPNDDFVNSLISLYQENRGLGIGDEAPDFELTDIFGAPVKLSELKGSVVYLDFWATWCSPCITQIRNSKYWKRSFEGSDVVFLYVSLDREEGAWQRYLSQNQIAGRHVFAGQGGVFGNEVAQHFGVKKLPTVFIVDKNGKIAYASPQQSGNLVTAEVIQSLL
ncbi:MAG: TlpA family protein disulfide reductase, partial [Saprospiraceae bacterium]|nr:TlpA family protein disulfide reductase [Saprospiraceae bacterium]